VTKPALKLLIIEDNPADADLVQEQLLDALQAPHFEVATRLADAIDKLQKTSFDFILLDLNLPDSRGESTYQAILEAAPRIPVLVLTGVSDEVLGSKAMQSGAQDYLVKGETTTALLERAIRYAIDRKQAELLLQSARQMEAVGQLAGGIAHDYNNVSMIISSYIELAQSAVNPDSPVNEYLRKASEAVVKAGELTHQLLALSRKHVCEAQPHKLGSLIRGLEPRLRIAVGGRIAIEIHDSSGYAVTLDRTQFEQCVLNLAINARDAMPSGGTITLATRDLLDDRGIAKVELTVEDTGTGIPERIVGQIFEPFFTTKPDGKGTGLGLALVKTFVNRFGGTVKVDSKEGNGTKFTMSFSVAVAEENRKYEVEAAAPVQIAAAVLVLEDEGAALQAISEFLTVHGFNVYGAQTVKAAKLILGERPIDVVVSDVILPDGSGIELAAEPGVRGKIIFMSGYTNDHLPQSVAASARFLQKPFLLSQLAGEIKACLQDRPAAAVHTGYVATTIE
jgi:two-component system, cell cycle sensor histidine kinase and response regulator CckA